MIFWLGFAVGFITAIFIFFGVCCCLLYLDDKDMESGESHGLGNINDALV